MKIVVYRSPSINKATVGDLYIDDEFECYSIEDEVRAEKIYGETAIPYGNYEVQVTYSPKFKKKLPLLIDVPNFSGVRIHPGNRAKDTEGCILVGTSVMVGTTAATTLLWNSVDAFRILFSKIKRAIAEGENVTIEFVEGVRA